MLIIGLRVADLISNFQPRYVKETNMAKFSTFKTNIENKINTLFDELKQKKFNREECLQHFPGYFHFENNEDKKNKSKLLNIVEEITFDAEPYLFPEFSIVFLIV
jgi:hypothetical protein